MLSCDYRIDVIPALTEGLVTQGFCVQHEVLLPSVAEALFAEIMVLEEAGCFKPAAIGHNQVQTVNRKIRSDQIFWLDKAQSSPALQAFWELAEGLRLALNQALFLGLESLEAHYALYEPGAYYARHRDRFRDQDTRQVSLVLYLNPNWQVGDGGELCLYHQGQTTEVCPRNNTLVCFLSDMWHEVKVAKQKRCSLTGWYLRRDLQNPLKSWLR